MAYRRKKVYYGVNNLEDMSISPTMAKSNRASEIAVILLVVILVAIFSAIISLFFTTTMSSGVRPNADVYFSKGTIVSSVTINDSPSTKNNILSKPVTRSIQLNVKSTDFEAVTYYVERAISDARSSNISYLNIELTGAFTFTYEKLDLTEGSIRSSLVSIREDLAIAQQIQTSLQSTSMMVTNTFNTEGTRVVSITSSTSMLPIAVSSPEAINQMWKDALVPFSDKVQSSEKNFMFTMELYASPSIRVTAPINNQQEYDLAFGIPLAAFQTLKDIQVKNWSGSILSATYSQGVTYQTSVLDVLFASENKNSSIHGDMASFYSSQPQASREAPYLFQTSYNNPEKELIFSAQR